MSESKPIPVRLDQQVISRLAVAAKRMGTNRAALIRFLTQTFLDHFEQHGGTTALPHNWQEILRLQDGRAFGQQKPPSPTRRKSPAKAKRTRLRDIDTVSLSVFGVIPAGWPQTADQTRFPVRYVRVARGRFPEGAFGLDVRGDSMNAAKPDPILDGHTVVLMLPEQREPRHNDIVAALCDGQTTLKRLVFPKGKPCVLRAESKNPAFARDIVPAHDLTIQGVVIGKL